MNDTDRKKAAARFVENWKSKGGEKQHAQQFWSDLLHQILGITDFSNRVQFEKKVPLGHESFIDVYIPESKTIIEQKSKGVDLLKKKKQSDGSQLNAFEQARRYNSVLPHDENARWIVTCNFDRILIYNMNNIRPADAPIEILLEDLPEKYHKLNFLIDPSIDEIRTEAEISEDAGYYVGKLYDALRKSYTEPDSPETLHSLNILMVRLVFLLYAEDAGLLHSYTAFGDYCKSYKPENLRSGLKDLFEILDTKIEERDEDEPEKLLMFPYINGNLFSNSHKAKLPKEFSEEAYNILVNEMSFGMNWKHISPTIFGMVFESTLDSKMRHAGGMHYTSLENIHKILDNLFLNDLRAELDEIKGVNIKKKDGSRNTQGINARNNKLDAFCKKLSKIHIFDPAAGSGNFLTESYLSLRKLENEALAIRYAEERFLPGFGNPLNPILVNINQLHGIEINDFAVSVAKTALWIAEAQMFHDTVEKLGDGMKDITFFPLHNNSNIIEGNALQINWNDIISKYSLTYIIGNPPFLGARVMSAEQKADMLSVFGKDWHNVGNLDYVSGWYLKAAEIIYNTNIKVAFVSTNSITQGEQVSALWKNLITKYKIHIDFAYRTFKWESKSKDTATVHVIIIAFSYSPNYNQKFIFDNETKNIVSTINPYLIEAPTIFIDSRIHPICQVPEIGIGNKPIDGGNYLFKENEMQEFIKKEPASAKYFHPWFGSDEFIKGKKRFCLWLGEANPVDLLKLPECRKRIEAVRNFRLQSKSEGTKKIAEKPTRFHVENMPKGNYILIPRVSSENRKYIPIGFMKPNSLSSDSVHIISDISIYVFGILTSNVHMAWMRATAGRLEMRYRYSKDIVYNNFPWPTPTDQQQQKIEKTAQAILDARNKYTDASLGDMYSNLDLFSDLKKAHQENDKAVMEAYGMLGKVKSEAECVSWLFRMYEALTKEK